MIATPRLVRQAIRAPAFWGILAALAVIVPGLSTYDFQTTDLVHVAIVSGSIGYPGMSDWNLYRFADGIPEHNANLVSNNYLPWFASPFWRFNFLRPIPSLLISAHYRLFGLNRMTYPAHSLLWLLVLIVLFARLSSTLFPQDKLLPFLAVLMFALSPAHAASIFYCAARYMFIVSIFCVLGLLSHIRWREQAWKPGRILSLVSFSLALLAGEAALAGIMFLVCYEALYSRDSAGQRFRALAPVTVLVIAYLAVYKFYGLGTAGQDTYVNPFSEPARFITLLPGRISILAGETAFHLLSVMPAPLRRHPELSGAAGLLAVGLLTAPAWFAGSGAARLRLNFLLAGTFLCIVPLCTGTVSARMTIIPATGGCIALAYVLSYWIRRLVNGISARPAGFAGLVTLCLIYLQLVGAPVRWITMIQASEESPAFFKEFHEQPVLRQIAPDREFYFLNYSDWMDPMDEYYDRKINGKPLPRVWRQLSYSSDRQTYRRTGDNTLELTVSRGSAINYAGMTTVFRSKSEPFREGNAIRLPGVQIRILKTDGFAPIRLEYSFDHSLDDPRYGFFKFEEGMLIPVQLPARGESISF